LERISKFNGYSRWEREPVWGFLNVHIERATACFDARHQLFGIVLVEANNGLKKSPSLIVGCLFSGFFSVVTNAADIAK
jgi:hypothetical protein